MATITGLSLLPNGCSILLLVFFFSFFFLLLRFLLRASFFSSSESSYSSSPGTRCGDGFPVITRIMQVALSDV